MTNKKGKWIEFVEIETTTKTQRFDVVNTETKYSIGIIKWYGSFRQYSFFPNDNTVYEKQCLLDISNFLKDLMEKRKLQKEYIEMEIKNITSDEIDN